MRLRIGQRAAVAVAAPPGEAGLFMLIEHPSGPNGPAVSMAAALVACAAQASAGNVGGGRRVAQAMRWASGSSVIKRDDLDDGNDKYHRRRHGSDTWCGPGAKKSMSTSQWRDVKKNCSGYKKQFQPKSITERVYAKLSLNDIIKLLDGASGSARAKVIALREHMSERPWELRATVHEGGRGGDDELHFNILVSGAGPQKKVHYHIRCKALKNESVVVFDVTGK